MLVKVPGSENYVNPQYVTNVFPTGHPAQRGTRLYVVGQEGYGTKLIESNALVAEVVAALNAPEPVHSGAVSAGV